jgi:hypothetical protein
MLKGFAGSITLSISDLVIAETQRNLAKNAPEALPYFLIIVDLLAAAVTNPTKAEVLKAHRSSISKTQPLWQELRKHRPTILPPMMSNIS